MSEGRPYDEVVRIMEVRRAANSRIVEMMLAVRTRYDGDLAIPLPDMDTAPIMPTLTPALVAQTIDHHAIRAASTPPGILVPPLDPMKDTGVRSKEYARIRQKALYATWFRNKFNLGIRRMYRHLTGYATAVAVVVPDYINEWPSIEVRDPLSAYPEPKAAEDLSPVANCGFIYERSAHHLRERYPKVRRENGGPIGEPGDDTELWNVVEWLDEECCIIGILGPRDNMSRSAQDTRQGHVAPFMELRRYPNPLGRCPVISMPRVTLDRIASQIQMQMGNIDLQAKMLALAIVAEERAVFPDRWVVGRPGEAPRIISNGGNWMDGRTGATNILDGVGAVGQLDSAPPDSTGRTIDRLERNFRVSVGDVPAFGGETYGALRTGRGIDSMLNASVDPMVQELQEIMQAGLGHLNELILDTWSGCFGHDLGGVKRKFELFSGWGGVADIIEFEPVTHVESTANSVSYAIAGADVQAVTIQVGQMLGAEMISQDTARQMHPWISDAEHEEQQLNLERLSNAAWQAAGQRLVAGEIPLETVPMLEKHLKNGKSIAEAMAEVQKEMQELQATPAVEPPPEAGMIAPPETMLGLEAGPAGVAQPPPPDLAPQIGPSQGQQGLQQLFAALRAQPT